MAILARMINRIKSKNTRCLKKQRTPCDGHAKQTVDGGTQSLERFTFNVQTVGKWRAISSLSNTRSYVMDHSLIMCKLSITRQENNFQKIQIWTCHGRLVSWRRTSPTIVYGPRFEFMKSSHAHWLLFRRWLISETELLTNLLVRYIYKDQSASTF